MITEDYVSYETAKLLKEKGFNENTDKQFNLDKIVGDYNITDRSRHPERYLDAPTLQLTMKWLREVHNIAICICAYYSDNPYELNYRDNKPYWKIRIMNHIFSRDYDSFNTYEEAVEAAIKYCLENLI